MLNKCSLDKQVSLRPPRQGTQEKSHSDLNENKRPGHEKGFACVVWGLQWPFGEVLSALVLKMRSLRPVYSGIPHMLFEHLPCARAQNWVVGEIALRWRTRVVTAVASAD